MTDTVTITTKGNGISIDTPTDNSNAVLTDITDTVLVVQDGETFTIPSGELYTRKKAIVDGELIIDGKLTLTE